MKLTLIMLCAVAGTPQRLTHDGLEKQRPAWAPDGRVLTFARHEPDGMRILQYVWTPESAEPPRRLTKRDVKVEYNATYAPDGKRLLMAIVSLSGTQGNVDLAVVGVDGEGLKPLVTDSGKLAHQDWPSWSPDGSRFAFQSTHEGNQEIYTAASNGTGLMRVTQSPGHDAHPSYVPAGDSILFATDRWGGLEIASVQLDGRGVNRLTESPGLDDYPVASPDGRRMAFVSNRDGNYEIYVADIDGKNPVNLTRHPGRDAFPTWTPDGRGITFVSDRDGGVDLYTIPAPP